MGILQFKKANCKNCYKCVRNCPVKAIEVKDHQARIIEDDCILCGNCIAVCPQNAKQVRHDVKSVQQLLAEKEEVYVSVAPSYIAYYPVDRFEDFREALCRLGFTNAYETAEGAYVVKTAYEKRIKEDPHRVWISTCCPTVVRLVQQYYPKALACLMPVLSPMQAHIRMLKKQHPKAGFVFVGPCISKKEEKNEIENLCDEVLTFEELDDWLQAEHIMMHASKGTLEKYRSRFFPMAGGIIESMQKQDSITYISVDGLGPCEEALQEICSGHLTDCFIEMSACQGSCVGGHATGQNPAAKLQAVSRVESVAKSRNDFEERTSVDLSRIVAIDKSKEDTPSEQEIQSILRKMGKHTPEDELNCGTCGYNTCREKAIAVYHKKADITMCLPYMKEKAESFSDQIIRLTPNGILTVDHELRIQQINEAACQLLSVTAEEIEGKPISNWIDEYDFAAAIAQENAISAKEVYWEAYQKYVEQILVYDKASDRVICIIKDMTDEKRKHDQQIDKQRVSLQMADTIVEKQLRVVQEIASLLGETAAETKVAVSQLKDAILKGENAHE